MESCKTKIIADCSSNHMGDMNIALHMIELAAQAGVDTVKFQSWQADQLRKDFAGYEQTYARHSKTQLSDADHFTLIKKCEDCNIEFLTTCFDLQRVDFLASLGLKTIKVASPDCASFTLLDRLMEKFDHLIVSTGMSSNEEIEALANHVKGHKVTILHCVSIYPTPLEHINYSRMNYLQSFGMDVGFSDHSLGTDAGKLAIARGEKILEKHFTLSRNLPGQDQAMSTEIQEFAELVRWRDLVSTMMGVEQPGLSEREMALRDIYIGKWGNNR